MRKKKVSSVELTRACLARIEQLNPALNAFITIAAESAPAQAHEREEAVSIPADKQNHRERNFGKSPAWLGGVHAVTKGRRRLCTNACVCQTADAEGPE